MKSLNDRAWERLENLVNGTEPLGVSVRNMECGTIVVDAGVEAAGGVAAGLAVAEAGMACLGTAQIEFTGLNGIPWPSVVVRSDHPLEACFLSQSAHWPIRLGDFRAMGSGPACLLNNELDPGKDFNFKENSQCAVLVLETRQLPSEDQCISLARACRVDPQKLGLMITPTSSLAGSVQIAARSVETAFHKLHTLGFDLQCLVSAVGRCPLSPPTGDDFTSLGRTNDMVMLACQVWMCAAGVSDDRLVEIAACLPASTSPNYGPPFLEALQKAGGFYELDPGLFAPAEITLVNLDSGSTYHAGSVDSARLERMIGR